MQVQMIPSTWLHILLNLGAHVTFETDQKVKFSKCNTTTEHESMNMKGMDKYNETAST